MNIKCFILMLLSTLTWAAEKPNIIVIFTDDQGYADLGCQNILQDLKTPFILDGVNLMPYLRDDKPGEPHDALFFRWMGRMAIRTKDWKLLRQGDTLALYRMQSSSGERDDVSAQHPEIVTDLNKRLSQWNATLPEIEIKQTTQQRQTPRKRKKK